MTTFVHARDCAAPTPDVCSCCGLPAFERASTFRRRGVTATERAAFCACATPFFWVDYVALRDAS